MRKDLITFKPIYSSFLSHDEDIQAILKLLFVSSKPYSNILKRLLIINNKDCLDTDRQDYQQLIDSFTVQDLIDKGYIKLNPKIKRITHEQVKTYIMVNLDAFTPNPTNPAYRQYNIIFDVICYTDENVWVLNDYKLRPLMICGYIDGILNSLSNSNNAYQVSNQSQIKLSGIGEYEFLGCLQTVLNEDLAMYTLSYHGMHFTEDIQKIGEV